MKSTGYLLRVENWGMFQINPELAVLSLIACVITIRWSKMNQNEQTAYWQRVGANINLRRAIAWFMGISLPIAIGLSNLISWYNEIVDEPNAVDILMRAAVALPAFGIGCLLMFRKVFKPAIHMEKERGLQSKESPNIRTSR